MAAVFWGGLVLQFAGLALLLAWSRKKEDSRRKNRKARLIFLSGVLGAAVFALYDRDAVLLFGQIAFAASVYPGQARKQADKEKA